MSKAEGNIVPEKPTCLLVEKGTTVYVTSRTDKFSTNTDDWKGLTTSKIPLYLDLSPQAGAKLIPLRTRRYTHHLWLGVVPNHDEIDAILASFEDVTNKKLDRSKISGLSGAKIAEAIADYSMHLIKEGGFLAKRAKMTKEILTVAGYQGTVDPINLAFSPDAVRLTFFYPNVSLVPSSENPEEATRLALENHQKYSKSTEPMFRS